MKTIYVDSDFKCHMTDDGTMTKIETDFFNDKCNTFIEGYRLIPNGEIWIRSDGVVFSGEMISPWKPYDELDAAQRKYERQLIEEQKEIIAELDAALLDAQYIMLTEGL